MFTREKLILVEKMASKEGLRWDMKERALKIRAKVSLIP
jgi:hypothetical protein